MGKNFVAVIMAGGLGKRMESNIPKVLHKINDIPMINSILMQLKNLSFIVNLEKIIIVVVKYKEEIKSVIDSLISLPEIVYVTQEEPRGTGHAIICCKCELLKHIGSDILILSGDVPMLSSYTMKSLYCPLCFIYDCPVHDDHRLIFGTEIGTQFVSSKNKK